MQETGKRQETYTIRDAERVLRQYFGYDSFRPGQQALITAFLRGRDVLGVMPTGAGKSLCYEVPALLYSGTAIVVSPLISLMEDQAQALQKKGIHAVALHSMRAENRIIPKILFVSPERLQSKKFQKEALRLDLSFLCVDEAHCISRWGNDFRPAYRKMHTFVRAYEEQTGRPLKIAAFTATADAAVRREIIASLHLRKVYTLTTGFDRPNLYFGVLRPENKYETLKTLLAGHPGESGIVYCLTRKSVEALAARLAKDGFPVAGYHAGMEGDARTRTQEAFLKGEIPVIVATNAFGMGIDKPDVRFVFHYNMPRDMESYYQEAGRAGRDGFPAECILLFGYRDIMTGHFFIDRTAKNTGRMEGVTISRRKLQDMMRYVSGEQCLRAAMLSYFGEHTKKECGYCSVCVGKRETPEGRNFRQAGTTAIGVIQKEKRRGKIAQARVGMKIAWSGIFAPRFLNAKEEALLQLLTALRGRIAKERGMKEERIFSDATLRAMAVELPKSRFALLCIDNIRILSVLRFGKAFLTEIRLFNALPE